MSIGPFHGNVVMVGHNLGAYIQICNFFPFLLRMRMRMSILDDSFMGISPGLCSFAIIIHFEWPKSIYERNEMSYT